MDISVLPILSLIIFSPIVGIALAAISREVENRVWECDDWDAGYEHV